VSAVAATLTDVPLDGDAANLKIEVVGRVPEASLLGSWRIVSPDYFAVFRIPLVAGRLPGDRDHADSEPIVVINQSLARRFWPDGNAIEGRILLGRGAGPEFEDAPRRIVGIVGDTRQAGLDRDPRPAAYVPMAQLPDAGMEFFNRVSGQLTWVLRANAGADAAFVAAARGRLGEATGIPVSAARLMSEVARASTARTRFEMWLIAIFGAAAAFLAALGVYGVASAAVQQRTREIGIRLALGATAKTIRRVVLRRGMVLAIVGIGIGLATALALSRALSSFVFGISPRDRIAFVAVPVILAAISLVATWLPARRAMRVDPAITLRAE
jgi:putative ABC transport system permease protein